VINPDEFVIEIFNNPASIFEINFYVIFDDNCIVDWFAVPTQH
jgi:hypothetical protein